MSEIELSKAFADGQLYDVLQKLIDFSLGATKHIVLAVLAYIVGRWIFKKLTLLCVKLMEKRNIDISLKTFLKSLINISTTILLFIIVIGILGVDTASFIALFASAGVAIGMALSGTLQNFAGGVMILLFKPFKVGDVIEAQGYVGVVKEIQIFNTLLTTPDNQVIFIPNGGLSTGTLKNISHENIRRVDLTVGVAYGEDYDHVKSVLEALIVKEGRIMKVPESVILLSKLGNSSVEVTIRCWVNASDYWDVFFDMNEKIYKTFAQEKIEIPFPQMDVHVVK